MRPARHLMIFVPAPRLGRVKSRLSREIGALAALRFYRATVEQILRRFGRDARWHCRLAVTPDRRAPLPRTWRMVAMDGQGPGDLGRRMARPFRVLPPGPAVIIGSDIPEIMPHHVAAAFHALGDHQAVFGPAADGGYWLVGLRRRPRLPPRLFTSVRWSGAHALADTLAALPHGLSVAFLETLEDIDDAEAYHRWRRRISRPLR